jgi:predicted dehydrogenase
VFRWGIIGTGYVARKFVLGLRQSDGGRATLVYSRTETNARNFARNFGIADVAPNLESAARSVEVDAVYIATPPSAHRDHAIACLSVGKTVLVEKPFAPCYADAEAMVEAARSSGTFCMEAMWTRYLPLLTDLRAMVRSGVIGSPRSLSGSFGASNVPDAAENLFNLGLGGGALLHRGIYPLAMAFDLLGPAELAASAATRGATGVDEDCVLVLRHDNGALSTLRASLRAPLGNDLTIEGTHGAIHVLAPIFRPFRLTLTKAKPAIRAGNGNPCVEAIREGTLVQTAQQRLRGLVRLLRSGATQTVIRTYGGNGYHYEADEVMRCVRRGARESDVMPLSQSVAMAALMDQARASWTDRPEPA